MGDLDSPDSSVNRIFICSPVFWDKLCNLPSSLFPHLYKMGAMVLIYRALKFERRLNIVMRVLSCVCVCVCVPACTPSAEPFLQPYLHISVVPKEGHLLVNRDALAPDLSCNGELYDAEPKTFPPLNCFLQVFGLCHKRNAASGGFCS